MMDWIRGSKWKARKKAEIEAKRKAEEFQEHVLYSEPRLKNNNIYSYVICYDKLCEFHSKDDRFRWIYSRHGDWFWKLKFNYSVNYDRFMNPYPYPIGITSGTGINTLLGGKTNDS